MAGGTILARREVQERIPVDRTLIREFSMEFSGELRRLESVYLDDLQQLAAKASTENQTALKELCSSLRGVRQFSLLYKKSERQAKHIKTGPLTNEQIPEPVVRSAKEPLLFPHQVALAREQLFPKSSSAADKDEGWVMPRDGKFAVFWKRSGEDTVQAFILDMREIGKIASDYLKPKITILYAPVRAEGGRHRLEGPGGVFLAGLE